ncbi:GGDEF domain-containing protein [Pelagibacterium sp. H642]|uniref:GGDEF domain-containing protein n=1 Tax=Pelagibacterium sp. H642 TaxID=1881069 RepID=UPI002815DC11|nr:GGDEF domain-containing protein [Pelagibacterium sp. H642]WMT92667.1 GGDEF domain-containing protein [Pelagibacterium sp. H642]
MQLDFITLYVIILLNSASFAAVWALIAYSYRSMAAARYWLAALLMTCASGPMLFLGEGGPLGFTGLSFVAGSFATMWQGLRVFRGHRFDGRPVVILMVCTMVGLLAIGSSQEAVNLVAAVSQIVPVSLALAMLWTAKPRSGGTLVAATAALIVILGQGGEAVANLLRLLGMLSSAIYYDFAAWFLVCAIIGGSVWNLGFLLMVADRLRSNLVDLATRDDLTGLLNRRGLRERMLLCEKAARRDKASAVLMMIDLDKFKSINDRHGHAAGDAALIHIAGLTRSVLRENAVLARVGGDEFCVLLPHTSKVEAGRMAMRLTDAIKWSPLQWNDRPIKLSASIGVAEWSPGGSLSLFESLERADELMFWSKRNNHSALDLAG